MKHHLSMIRLLLLLLAAIFVFSACGKPKETVEANTSGIETEGGEKPDQNLDENGFLKDDLPALNYRDSKGNLTPVTILSWIPEQIELNVDSPGGDVISDTIYKRNQAVEERLGVYLDITERAGDVKNCSKFMQHVDALKQAGDHRDIIAAHTRTTAMCASKGLLKDLNDIRDSYLDLEKPWWSSDLTQKATVSNRLFFATGDISSNFLQMIYCVYFNAEKLGDITDNDPAQSPYAMVENNTWTLENMIALTKGYYLDLNQNNEIDLNDQLAVVGEYYAWPALLHGCGVSIADRNHDTGALTLNADFKGEKAQRIVDNLLSVWMNDTTDGGGIVSKDTQGKDDSAFLSGNALFYLVENGRALTYLKGKATFEYGCVPAPKYNSDQENYYSTVRQTVTLYGIMVNTPNDELQMITATLEGLASESYRAATPVIFGVQIQDNSSASSQMRQMQQLIRDTAFFDFARIFSEDLDYPCDKLGYVLMADGIWSGLSGYMSTVEQKLQVLNNTLQSLQS